MHSSSTMVMPVSNTELNEMAARRKTRHVSLEEANRARAAAGLQPLGFLAENGYTLIVSVPRQW